MRPSVVPAQRRGTLAEMLSKMAGAVALSGLAASAAGANTTTFRLVHMNDFHGRVEGVSESEGSCVFTQRCDGGWPRIFSAARRMVSEAGSVPVIFVDDGDQFMGTVWSSFYKGAEARAFLGRLCAKKEDGGAGFAACVGTLGNHEFDFQNPTLVSYLKSLENITMVSSNIQDDCVAENDKVGPYLKKTHVVELPGGAKVGFVGYTTLETALTSSASPCTKFLEEEAALPGAIANLTQAGVKIVVAAGHSGYARDKEIARAVAGLDLIVSGHSHTFLWMKDAPNPSLSGAPNAKTAIVGDYATLVPNANNVTVPIVQAFWAGRFLGNIEVTFDDAGVLQSHRPLEVLVASNSTSTQFNYADDGNATALLKDMAVPLSQYTKSPAGTVDGVLNGTRAIVRTEETNLGNLICDAMMDHANAKPKFANSPEKVNLCLHNAGGIRASIGLPGQKTKVTLSDVIAVLPFANLLGVVEVTGLMVWNMVEHGTARVETQQGEFGQFGKGFRVWYSRNRKPACGFSGFNKTCTSDNTDFSRVSRIELNGEKVPKDATKKYNLVTVDFLTRGKDGYTMLTNATTVIANSDAIDEILLKRLLALNATSNGAVTYEQDCRILLEEAPSQACIKLGVVTAAPTAPTTSAPTTSAPTGMPTPAPAKTGSTAALVGGIIGGLVATVALMWIGIKKCAPEPDSDQITGRKVDVETPAI